MANFHVLANEVNSLVAIIQQLVPFSIPCNWPTYLLCRPLLNAVGLINLSLINSVIKKSKLVTVFIYDTGSDYHL